MSKKNPYESAVRALAASEPKLAPVIAKVGPCLLGLQLRDEDHFAGLVEAIVSQQLSPKAADTIFGRVRALAPERFDAASLLVISDDRLRQAGLSGAKARYIRGLCEATVRGSLRLHELEAMDDEKVVATLCELDGIGRWTAEMVLMFRLRRLDVLPVGDLGIRKGFQKLYRMRDLPTADRMTKLSKPWRPYRSIACWYLWRLNEQ